MDAATQTDGRIGIRPTLIRVTHSSVWLTSVDVYPALVAASLPWSTTAVSVLWLLWFLVLVPVIDYGSFLRSLARPACWLPLAFFALALTGMLWADGSWRDRFLGLRPVLKFVVLPFLMYHFRASKRGHWVFSAFVFSSTVLMVYSWVVFVEPSWKFSHNIDAGVPVKNSIDQSYEFALCIFILAAVALRLFNHRRLAASAACASLIAAFLANLMFVATSRTALVYMPFLLVMFAVRHFSVRSMAIFASAVVMVTAATWFNSSYLRGRVEHVRVEYKEYRATDRPTSTGERLTYWKESLGWIREAPLIGNGTGSTKQLFEAAAAGKAGAWADKIRNPHNQTLYVAIQWGLLGCILLFAIWYFHARLFVGTELVAWIGSVIVAQNFLSSLLNSHLFDFTEGWIYVLGVGVAGGLRLRACRAIGREAWKPAIEPGIEDGKGKGYR